ncbi:MAG: hypothetical protein PUB17_00340 [Lachnospiraceae bacterium]|nr:hypothetical protein [Lachnospiraceae bacterium]
MRKITKKIITFMLMALMLLAMPLTAFAEDETAKAPFDANGKYNARLGIQATTADSQIWLSRIGYYSSRDDGDKIVSDKDADFDAGTFTDAVIEGNGTYSVSYKTSNFGGAVNLQQLQVATDIPMENELTFSDLKVEINGNVVATYKEVYIDEDAYAIPYTCLLAYNNWRNDLKSRDDCMTAENALPESGDVEVKLTFTVNGFAYDAPTEAPTEAETTAAAATKAAASTTSDSSSTGLPIGAIIGIIAGVVVVVVIVIVAVSASKKKKA